MLFKESIVVAASPDRVWKYVGSPECWSLFDEKVERCEPIGAQGGRIGAVYSEIRRMGTKTTLTRSEIIDLRPARMIQVQSTTVDPHQPASHVILTYELDDLGTGMRVTARAEVSFPGMNIFLKALLWFVSRFGAPQGETALMKLKTIVEAD